MGRKNKEDEQEKILPKIRYIAKFENFSFDVQAVDEKGNPKIKMTNTGNPMYDKDGNTIPIHIVKKFKFIGKAMRGGFLTGYLSEFVFDPNDKTPQNIEVGKALSGLDANRGVEVETEDKYEKNENPQAYEAKQRTKATETELDDLRTKLNDPEELQRRLEELTKP